MDRSDRVTYKEIAKEMPRYNKKIEMGGGGEAERGKERERKGERRK